MRPRRISARRRSRAPWNSSRCLLDHPPDLTACPDTRTPPLVPRCVVSGRRRRWRARSRCASCWSCWSNLRRPSRTSPRARSRHTVRLHMRVSRRLTFDAALGLLTAGDSFRGVWRGLLSRRILCCEPADRGGRAGREVQVRSGRHPGPVRRPRRHDQSCVTLSSAVHVLPCDLPHGNGGLTRG